MSKNIYISPQSNIIQFITKASVLTLSVEYDGFNPDEEEWS